MSLESPTPPMRPQVDLTVRLANSGDSRALLRLASLDSASVPVGPIVVAETAGELVAAMPVFGAGALADPFRRTAALVEVLELRAAQLRAEIPAPPPRSLRNRLATSLRDARPVPFLP